MDLNGKYVLSMDDVLNIIGIIMKIQKRRQNSDPLHYRLYVLYFEGSKSLLKIINKEAFYRLSIWHDDQQIAEMMEGVNPTILSDKIFLKDAQVNFELAPQQHKVKLRLWYHLKSEDAVLAESDLNLDCINSEFQEQNVKYHGQLSTIFFIDKEQLKLIFNIFVDVDKKQLASYVRTFKEKEREQLKQKRLTSSKEKEKTKSPLHYSSIMLIERKTSLISQIDLGFKKDSKNLIDSLTFKGNLFQSIKEEEPKEVKDEENQKRKGEETKEEKEGSEGKEQIKEKKEQMAKVLENGKKSTQQEESITQSKIMENIPSQITSPKHYLEIESAARFHENHQKNIHNIKKALDQIKEKDSKSVYSSQMSAFQTKPETASKGLSINPGGEGASVISDGSEASEMIANNLNQSYSERAVAKFKATFFRFVNIALIIIAIILLYFLFVPRAKFSKNVRPSRMSKSAETEQV